MLRLDNAPRDVKWSSCDGYYVDNLLLVDCDTLDDVFSVLNEGSRNRKVVIETNILNIIVNVFIIKNIFYQESSLNEIMIHD